VIFNGDDPVLDCAKNVNLPLCSHVNEIHLKAIMELRRNDGLLGTFPLRHDRWLLHTNVAILALNFAQFLCGAIIHRLHCLMRLVYSKMTKFAMCLGYHIKDIKHVEDSAPRVAVNEKYLGGFVQSFCILQIEILCVVVSLWILLLKSVYSDGFNIILLGGLKEIIIPPK
jgi:hypothetical protein